MVHKYAAKDVKSSNYLKLQSQHPWWLFKLATLVCITSVWLSEFGAAIYGHFHTLIVSYPDCVQQGFFSFSFFNGGNWVDSENRLFIISNGNSGNSNTESINLYLIGQIIWSTKQENKYSYYFFNKLNCLKITYPVI